MTEHPVQNAIQNKLQALAPEHLEVINESYMHNVPEGSESHFKVVVVSDAFAGSMLVARHRKVNELLAEEIQGPVHALSIHAMTPEEWFESGAKSPESPECLGGNKL